MIQEAEHVGIGQAKVLTASTSKLASGTSEQLSRCVGAALG